ncbi:TIGR04282 family arsenosugar biosynthesis glycosyltransferase [Arthrobacter sp. H14-L1]|uniref:TIGR04282 family arsenosugar biosynthesis glycosyltransferase n=1 Tax=Arthrobacter sp. H14-L1 TaxID=2996697 RepID=UPI00226F5B38|nr:DUF2064 domain-containing protein [Arthrobacter sp. H14-L1]MCY0904407.1 DUF2064 domain-containing protein [Arthrobacter sp. H14-L1]
MITETNVTVAVIAKECVPGRVKTRLCPPLTPVQAAAIAQASLSQTLAFVRSLPVADRLLVLDGTARPQDAAGFRLLPQETGGLDERLAAICAVVPGPLLILGMDTPQLELQHVRELLDDWTTPAPVHDAWLGWASDGGFWGLAMHTPRGDLIRGVPMSTDQTGAQQLARLTGAGLRVGQLPMLDDVDTVADAAHVAAMVPRTTFAAAVAAAFAAAPDAFAAPLAASPADAVGSHR